MTLAGMSEAQRIGQLFMVGLPGDRVTAGLNAAIAEYHFGSVLFTRSTDADVTAIRAVSDAVQLQATEGATNKVPFFVAANQEGGSVQALDGPGFDPIPSALAQGGYTTQLLERRARMWAGQLAAAGVNLDLAPVADVVPAGTDAQNAPIGRYQREYGHNAATVSSHVLAFIAGMREAGIATAAKHFPGVGRVEGNTDFTSDVTDSVTTRRDPYLQPFAEAVRAGVPFIMVSLATYERIDPNQLAAFSPTVIGGMLRGDLGFRRVVMSDSLSATAVASIPPGTRAVRFVSAGGDMIVVNPTDQAITMARAIAERVAQSPALRARVDDAALHVLIAKEAAGLLDCR